MTTQTSYPRVPAPEPPVEPQERPLGVLFSDMTRSFQTLLSKEVELAKVEIKEEATRAARAAGLLAAGVVGGVLALVLVLFAGAWGLAEVLPAGVAFLIVGVVVGVAAASVALAGKKRLAQVRPVPPQTVQTFRQDVEVAKASITRGVNY